MANIEKGIDQRPNGKYRVRAALGERSVTKHFATLEEAREFRDAVYGEFSAGAIVPVEGMSIRDLRGVFLERRKRLRNFVTDRLRFDSHLATAPFAGQPVQTVTRRMVLEWVSDLETKQTAHTHRAQTVLSRQTRKHCLNLMRALFLMCMDRELVAVNPCDQVKVGGSPEVLADGWYLTPDEQEAVEDLDGPEVLIVLFAMGTGLRQGEQWNLPLSDVHVKGEHPRVLVRFGSDGRPPKNGKVRVVPLFGLGLEAARAWLKKLPRYAPKNEHGLMFPTPRGARRQKGKVPAVWPAVVAKLGRHVHWHLLRHTCASSLVAGWWGRRWRLEEVRDMMGHSSITVTQRYAHLATSRLLEVAAEASAQWLSRDVPSTAKPAAKRGVVRPSKPLVAGSSPAERAAVKQGVSDGVGDPSRDNAGTTGLAGFGVWTEEGQ